MADLPNVRELSDDDKVRLGIYHTMDHDFVRGQVDRLCGKVRARQDGAIRRAIVGSNVLDVGSGYGTLTRDLRRHGFNVIALEPHDETRALALEWFGVSSSGDDIYTARLNPGSIDTVIFRESVEHLDMELALSRMAEISAKRVIIFQSNLNWMLKISRAWMGHEEFNPKARPYYEGALARHGFKVVSVVHRDVVAFPLSGGFLLKQRFPRIETAEKVLVAVDEALGATLNATGLGPMLCWRYLLVADRG
jgi:SAM-dependent methyltransferase